jgi:hypothetical protein
MTKNEEIDQLLMEWKTDLNTTSRFIEDGIIDENLYSTAGLKILFIAKEPNSRNHKDEIAWDFRKWWREPHLKYSFSQTLNLWAFGLLNNFPQIIDEKRNSLSQVAFINVKKTCGGAETNRKQMNSAIDLNSDLVRRQINIIAPDVIVTCFSADHGLTSKLLGIELSDCLYGIKVGKFKNSKVVSFYHPSMRAPGEMSYVLLKEIINSGEFKKL